MVDEYVSRRAAEQIIAENASRLGKIERMMVERIVARVAAGDDPRVATAEEARRAQVELGDAANALKQAFDELPCYPGPPKS